MMYRGTPIAIAFQEAAPQVNSIPNRVQLMRTGNFFSPEYGDLEISPAMLQSFVKNFQAKTRGVDLAIDYSHNSEDVAAGWFKDLYLSEDKQELWAEIAWTKNGETVVNQKEFRYVSAEFDLDYTSNEGKTKFGPTLWGAGLTNRPFIKNMKPVIDLSEKPADLKGNQMDEKDKKISELEATIAALKTELESLKKPKATEPTQPTAPTNDPTSLQGQIDALQKQVKAYQEKEKQLAEQKVLSEKKEAFNKLLSEGKAVEAQRDAFMIGDTVKFAENARPVNLSGHGNSHDSTNHANSSDPQAQVLKLAEALVNEKKVQSLSEGVKKILAEHADLKKQYEQAFN